MDENQAGPRKQQRESKKSVISKLYAPYSSGIFELVATHSQSKRLVQGSLESQLSIDLELKIVRLNAAFARKRNVRRGLWRQPNIASMAEQLALSDYKTPAAQRATQS